MINGPELSGVTSYACWTAPSGYTASSLFEKQVSRNDSPPRREDEKDGHYKFELGENLTSRCNSLTKSSKFTHILGIISFCGIFWCCIHLVLVVQLLLWYR